MIHKRLSAAALALALSAAPALAQAPSTATQTIDTMNTLWGRHPGMRANHAKGVVVLGSFTPTPAAKALSKAAIFAGATVPVTVRFSDSTGLPTLPDGAPNANPHGMAIKFQPAGAATVEGAVVGREHAARSANGGLHHRMAPAPGLEGKGPVHDRPDRAGFDRPLGEGGGDIQPRQSLGRGENLRAEFARG